MRCQKDVAYALVGAFKLADEKLTVGTVATRIAQDAIVGFDSEKLSFTKSALLVAHGENRNLELASRNLANVKLSAPNALQPYEVLKHDRLLLSKDAVARLVRTLDPEKTPIAVPDVGTIAAAPAKKETAAAKKPPAKKAAKPAAKNKSGKG
jgi:hypothetical protein